MQIYQICLLFFFNIYIPKAAAKNTYFDYKQKYTEANNTEELEAISLPFCASVCAVSKFCCGFRYDKVVFNCLLLTECTYDNVVASEMTHFKNFWNADQRLRRNLARNKPCGQSSIYDNDPAHACDAANDGSFSTFIHTISSGWNGVNSLGESFPFWWVDLQTPRSVKEVVIHNRQSIYYDRLHNVNVTVGDDLSTLHECGYQDGPPKNMGPLTITCPEAVMGRFIQIMIMKESDVTNFLHVTEVEVYDCLP